jgi:hypothetical protein
MSNTLFKSLSQAEQYVNTINHKLSCKVATAGNITLSGEQTIDGISIVAKDRVLVKNQSTGSENGIYVCSTGQWFRATDMNSNETCRPNSFFFIEQGSTNGNKLFQLINDSITLGTTDVLNFIEYGSIEGITAGNGLNGGGTSGTVTLNVVGGTGIMANENDISIDSTVATLSDSQELTNKTLTSAVLNNAVLNTGVSGTAILDEDNMNSNSATQLATQQSIKAYVDNKITAQGLNFQGDYGGAQSVDLDSQTLTLEGGTGINTTGGTNKVSFAIDSTVATLSDSQELTNKTLTSAVLNTGVSGTAILDEAEMNSNSATQLATQKSIKAYVDSKDISLLSVNETDNYLSISNYEITQEIIPISLGGTNASSAADARTNLGLSIGTDVQAHDDGLTSIAGLTTDADKMIYTTGSDTYATTNLTFFARTLLNASDASTARETLEAGTVTSVGGTGNVNGLTLSGTVTGNGNLSLGGTLQIYDNNWSGDSLSVANGGTGATTAEAARINLGLNIGSDIQAYDSELNALASLTSSMNKIPMFNGLGTATTIDFKDDMASDSATAVASQRSIKAYVDTIKQGLHIKEACRVATTASGDLSLSFGNTDTIDGVILSTNDRILIKDQGNARENGIYIVNASGSPVRSGDMPADDTASGDFTFVTEGTVNGDHGFVCTSDSGSDVVGKNDLVFTQFSGAGQITAGDGLSKTGNQLDVDVKSNGGLVFESNKLALDLGASSITGTLAIGDGGTGATSASAARTALGITDNQIIDWSSSGAGTIHSTNYTNNMGSGFVLKDGDGTEVTITENKVIKFIDGDGININWTDITPGSDSDPYDLSFSLLENQTTITSIYNNSLKIGKATNQEYISFSTSDEVNTFVNDTEILSVNISGINITGTITGDTSLTLDSTTITTAEIGVLNGVTAGTAAGSKALVLDANKDIGTIRNLTINGTFSDGNYTFDTNGNVSGLGTIGCGVVTASGFTTTGTWTFDSSAGGGATVGIQVVQPSTTVFADSDVTLMTAAAIQDKIGSYAGTGLTLNSNQFVIDSTVVTLTGSQTLTQKSLTSPILTTPVLGTPSSGNLNNCTFPTLNQDTTGSAGSVSNALTAGTNISFSSGTTYDGSTAITISASDTNTTYTAGTGLDLSSEEFSVSATQTSITSIKNTGLELGRDVETFIYFSAGEILYYVNDEYSYAMEDNTFRPNRISSLPSLGNTTHRWSDLFLDSGGVINFNNGDIVLTHSTNTLAMTGASSGGFTCDGDITAFKSSDKRLKANIVRIGNPIEKIKKIGGYNFEWNQLGEENTNNKGKDVGVVAQEIEEVIPEIVTTRDNGYKAVQYEKIVPLLIECIKDQQIMIENLQGQIDEIKSKII